MFTNEHKYTFTLAFTLIQTGRQRDNLHVSIIIRKFGVLLEFLKYHIIRRKVNKISYFYLWRQNGKLKYSQQTPSQSALSPQPHTIKRLSKTILLKWSWTFQSFVRALLIRIDCLVIVKCLQSYIHSTHMI